MSRPIVVDDNDSGIIYTGSWFKDDSGTLNTVISFGPPMLGTLHGTNSTAGFTYTFSGTEFRVTNTNQFSKPTGLNITCLLDNEVVNVTIADSPLAICEKDGLADTQHTVVLEAVVTNEETFWFDYIRYFPSTSVPLDKAPLLIQHNDQQLHSGLSTGWNTFGPGFQTTQKGAQFSFPFTGVSLTWYGFYDPSLPWDTSLKTATYSIDGGSPISFDTLVDVTDRTNKPTGLRYNQVLFQTNDLPNTNHDLIVTFQGTNTSTPLTLQQLLVNPNPRGSPDSATSTTLPPANGLPKKARNLGAIVGAVIGVVTVVALLAVLFLSLRRRRQNGYRKSMGVLTREMEEPFEPISNQNHPYIHPSEATSVNTFNSLSTNMGTSFVVSPQASDPFADSNSGHHSDTCSRLQTPPTIQPHDIPMVELTPNGRIFHSNYSPTSNSGKGQIPMHIATTVIQDEDSGVRLPQSPDSSRVEILPPSYSRD